MNLEQYKKDRKKGVKRSAFTWDQIVSEVELAIGPGDAQLWLDDMQDILDNPLFVRAPNPVFQNIELTQRRIRHGFPHVTGQTWVCPHTYAWKKLGYYQIWSPDLTIREVNSDNEVRKALGIPIPERYYR